MLLIGVVGKAGHGKDECYKAIKSFYKNRRVERIAYADALKQEVARTCGVTVEYIEQHKDNFRLILQGVGTDYRRKLFGDDYWIIQWHKKLLASEADIIVTPDVRFTNEFNTIREIGGKLWKVERKTFELGGHKETTTEKISTHSSETEQDSFANFDVVITNGGTVQNLHDDIHLKLKMLKYDIYTA